MESKTKTADITVRASFALIEGALLAMLYPLFYFLFPALVKSSTVLFLFLVFPAVSFFISMLMNVFLQYLYCGSVSIGKTATASAITPLSTGIAALLAYFLPFLRGPIGQLFSESPQDNLEEATFIKDIWGYAFYLFWGGVYGQTIGSGMISSCPS